MIAYDVLQYEIRMFHSSGRSGLLPPHYLQMAHHAFSQHMWSPSRES